MSEEARATANDALPVRAVAELLERRVPKVAASFDLSMIALDAVTGLNVFEVRNSACNRITVSGSSGVALAMGVNWYLKTVCRAHMSWCGDRMDVTPADIGPVPGGKLRVVCPHRHVVYLNYCTQNYSASWWDWPRWEREIDFMALNGVTMPLAMVGLEGVWYHALLEMGLTDDEARSFLVGPAFLAWQWMANIDAHGGPLPRSWIESHVALGRRIVERERAFGMTPIQQGYSGHVPEIFKMKFPSASIAQKPSWCSFPGTWQLDPLDPLFAESGRVFMGWQKKLFGLGGLYAADPFHESEPPRPGETYLRQVGEAIQSMLDTADTRSVWVMQSWSLRKEIACAVPKKRLLVLDLGGAGWRQTEGFWGHDFVVGQLHNFGGRTNLHGDLAAVAGNPFLEAGTTCPQAQGMGLFMEGIEQNPVFYDLVFDMVWRNGPVELDDWLRGYVRRRYGVEGGPALEAWMLLKESAYRPGTSDVESSSIIAARPALEVKKSGPNAGFRMPYEQNALARAWSTLLNAADSCGTADGYRFDLADVGRQVLSNLGQTLQREARAAFERKDAQAFDLATERFLDLLLDVDTLVGTRREYRFSRWISEARGWGTTDQDRRLYEKNASMLVSIWGPEDGSTIFDYSWREWSGLIRDYYLPRWEMFFRLLAGELAAGREYTEAGLPLAYGREAWQANEFYAALARRETEWVNAPKTDVPTASDEDAIALSGRLTRKWCQSEGGGSKPHK
ncbi:MAG: alpha-N-acetylglucosaminidase [Kiritimatiellae bacterium]|nr:alpha-N-acetylglucosaminidase [Kiritimatiellia bacterium]